jgi:ABC-type uncharacterized transport system permease subunit
VSATAVKDRLIYALIAALFGAIIGFILAWLFGVYSQRMGVARHLIDWKSWVINTSIIFGVIGLVFKDKAGDAVGGSFASLYKFEDVDNNPQVPTWFAVIFLILVAVSVWWFVRQ